MSQEEKERHSHRGKAIKKIKEYLSSKPFYTLSQSFLYA